MRHVRMLGLCLVAVLAVVVYAVSSASAATPEWGQCYAKEGGKYEDSNCQTKAKGKTGKHSYEWRKGAEITHRKFTGEGVGGGGVLVTYLESCGQESVYDNQRVTQKKCVEGQAKAIEEGKETEEKAWNKPASNLKIECEAEHNRGEAVAKDEVAHVSVIFKGCKLSGAFPCANTPTSGEIDTNFLKGTLGYINKSSKEVGVDLTPEVKHGLFANFNCANVFDVYVGVGNSKEGAEYEPESKGGNDGIISPITPVDQMSDEFKQVFTYAEVYNNVWTKEAGNGLGRGREKAYENLPTHFEGKPISLLETYTVAVPSPEVSSLWGSSAEEITNVNYPEEEVEIKA